MAKYRKKPIVVEADQYIGDKVIPGVCMKRECLQLGAHIHARDGMLHVYCMDWVIRGVRGEIYPCRPDVFAATYEQVSDTFRLDTLEDPENPTATPIWRRCPACGIAIERQAARCPNCRLEIISGGPA